MVPGEGDERERDKEKGRVEKVVVVKELVRNSPLNIAEVSERTTSHKKALHRQANCKR